MLNNFPVTAGGGLLTIRPVAEEEFFDGVMVPGNEQENLSSPGFSQWRAYRMLIFVLLVRPLGNLSLAFGMKHIGQSVAINPLFYLRAFLNPYVAIGVTFLILGLLLRMALLSVADLSFVLPLTALGYVISTILGRTVLHEEVSWERWLGIILIFTGTAVVGAGSPSEVSREV